MKHIYAVMFAAFLIVGAGSSVAVEAQRVNPACGYVSGGGPKGTFYMSCFNRLTGEATDRERIQFAVDFIGDGKLIFDERDYTVSNYVNLDSYITIEGSGTGTTINPSPSRIVLTTSGTEAAPTAIFKIGETIYDVTVRDIGLVAAPNTEHTIGIYGEGAYPAASLNFQFNNIRFTNFKKGIFVNATDSLNSFQFDNVKLDHSTFEGCKTGVHINSFNSGWQMNSIEFFSGVGAVGVFIERGTYSTIDSLIGNGSYVNGVAQAQTLVKIKETASSISLRNNVSEGFLYDLQVDSVGISSPLTLISNFFQAQVEIKNANVLSIGNHFGISYNGGVNSAPQPIAKGGTRITSMGDVFCSEGASNCPTGGYQLQDTASILFSSDRNKNTTTRPTFMEHFLNITTDLPFEPNTPLLSLIRPTYNDVPLLRLGVPTAHYSLSRSGTNGWLNFAGSQTPRQYVGYKFDGPVKLPSFEAADLPPVLEEGAMVFCKLCQPNTAPCAAGGVGALAVSIGSSWVCK